MKRHGKVCVIALLFTMASSSRAEDSTRGKALNDPLLDKLIGDWNVERKMGNGRSEKTDGLAPRDETSNAMEFKFTFPDGELINRYAFDAQSGTWTSTIRQVEKGEWKLFCQDTFTRAGVK